MEHDFYEILQVSPRAEPEVIESAFRRLAQKYHPDINKAADAVERMKALNEAYAVLRDPLQRSQYDRKRGIGATGSLSQRMRPTPQYQPPVSHAPSRPTPNPQPPPQAPNANANAQQSPYGRDVFVSEALVADAMEILKTRSVLSVALLQHTMSIGGPRAERLLKVLMERDLIDASGRKIEKGNGKTDGGNEPSQREKLESLVPEALKLLRTEKVLNVQLLYETLGIGFTQAIALYSHLKEQQILDASGKPTAATKARLATLDLGPLFACPFCEDSFVHHYQTQKRFMPDAHFFKCPKCFAEFEPNENYKYKLVLVPSKYGRSFEHLRERSYTPAQWQAVSKSEKNK